MDQLADTKIQPISDPERPSATLAPEKGIDWILREFANFDGRYKREAMDLAVSLREKITPRLLAILEDLVANPEKFLPRCDHDHDDLDENEDHEHDNTWSHIYAVTLLSHFREKRAHRLIAEAFALDGETVYALWGDMITEDLPALLYSTYDGSPETIKSLVTNRQADDYCRTSAAQALAYCVAGGLLPRHDALDFLTSLFVGDEAKRGSGFWGNLACEALDLYPVEYADKIRNAFARGLIDETVVDRPLFEQEIREESLDACLEKIRREIDRYLPDDVHKRLEHWVSFREDEEEPYSPDDYLDELEDDEYLDTAEGLIRSEPKVGRNDPCPCGSGKKFKKCCLS